MVGARRLARPRLPDPKSGGSAIPRKPRAGKNGVPDRLRSGDLLHERQACCLDYTTGIEMERVNGIAPLSRPWHGRILLLNHTRKNGVPSRTLTSNLTLRTRLLCALSYGDEETRG